MLVTYILDKGPNAGRPRPALITEWLGTGVVDLTVFLTESDYNSGEFGPRGSAYVLSNVRIGGGKINGKPETGVCILEPPFSK